MQIFVYDPIFAEFCNPIRLRNRRVFFRRGILKALLLLLLLPMMTCMFYVLRTLQMSNHELFRLITFSVAEHFQSLK